MRVLIVENELYLAQSIAAKLIDIGYVCEFASTLKEAEREEDFDVVLLSTNISDQNFYPVIEMYKDAIIILMVSYINNDTVSKPLKAGASDYILKPFMIEELIRKIEHFKMFHQLKEENRVLSSYIDYTFSGIKLDMLFGLASDDQVAEDFRNPLERIGFSRFRNFVWPVARTFPAAVDAFAARSPSG
jgi:DNA-binding response OmpR family regulator